MRTRRPITQNEVSHSRVLQVDDGLDCGWDSTITHPSVATFIDLF